LIVLGLRTGSRPGVSKALEWSWIDLDRGLMYRRAPGTSEKGNKRTPPVKLGRKMIAHLKRWKRLDGGRCRFVVHYDGRQVDDPHTSWERAASWKRSMAITHQSTRDAPPRYDICAVAQKRTASK